MSEKRKSTRMELDAVVKLNQVKSQKGTEGLKKEPFDVHVLNLSRGGIAFESKEELRLNTFYDVEIKLWTKTSFNSVIEVVRMENMGEENTIYGCRFIGIKPSAELEIQIYEMLQGIE